MEPHKQRTLDPSIVVLPSDPDYIDQLVAVQRQGYELPPTYFNHPEVMTAEKFASHLRIFPQGQFMALDMTTGCVVGSCTSLRVHFDPAKPLLTRWRTATADGMLTTHQPDGQWLYGADSVVLPGYQGRGVGGKLIGARLGLVRKLNLRGMIAGSLIVGYPAAAAEEGISAEEYVADVVGGRRWDGNLSKQLKKGFRVHNVIPGYISESEYTLGYAAAIVWENPDYRPPKPQTPAPGRRLQPRTLNGRPPHQR